VDLLRRSAEIGLAAKPDPAVGGIGRHTLSENEIWDLLNFIRSLAK
jgi:hypothetical protein